MTIGVLALDSFVVSAIIIRPLIFAWLESELAESRRAQLAVSHEPFELVIE